VSAVGPFGGAATTGVDPAARPAAEPVAGRRRRRLTPYLLLLPGGLWLLIFFALPVVQLGATSLYDRSGSLATGYQLTWAFENYVDGLSVYWPHFARSLLFAGIATALALLLGFPLAYAIAQKAGRFKYLLLVCVIAPFFTSFLVRTLAWRNILSDQGVVVEVLRAVGLLGAEGRLLATPVAVIAGLTYNFLPFMVLPLYASLDKLDPRLLEAARDLYAGPWRAFRRVTLPLALPGVVAGTLLCFIPAAGDLINAQLLGTPREYMIGNVIQSAFLIRLDYPLAAALSFLLMGTILALVIIYVRRSGTEELV
jgi:spermidine/putrescine transport system permease protein